MDQLTAKLKKLEKQNYKAYQQIKGNYSFDDFTLYIDHVQGDPYASASRLRAIRPWGPTGLGWLRDKAESYQIAARDFIGRTFAAYTKHDPAVSIAQTGQTVLDHTSVLFTDEGIEIRFRVNLPAEGRSILAKKALNILTFYLPKTIRKSTIERELDIAALKEHCEIIEDQQALRNQLSEKNLVAFVGNGAVLPRLAGNQDLPLKEAVAFQSPKSLEVTLETPNGGLVSGMGIKKGVTLIVGGGFHGKSTLLNAIERSVYNHIPGDGREYVVALSDAMKIKAEDGRCVHKLNLSNYINNLPMGKDTSCFSTQDASGSTSQAAWLQESLESGTSALLIDEDTSATNFLIRDERMQALVSKGDEPITPLVDRIDHLRDEQNVSTIIVMGGSGDYLDVADTVIQMHDYQALDITQKAKQVIAEYPSQRKNESSTQLEKIPHRKINKPSLQTILSEGKFRVTAKGLDSLRFGKEYVDLSALEQLESSSEVNAIGWLWLLLAQSPNSKLSPSDEISDLIKGNMFGLLPPHGDLAKPRAIDVMAALNRLRKVKFN